jgi:stage V sporulation protein B
MAVIDYIFIRRSLGENPNLAKALGRPFLCSLVMGIAAFAVYRLASAVLGTGSSLKMLLSLGTAVLVAVVIYLSAVIQTRTITNADMKLIPGGERIGRLLHMKDS